MEKKQKIIEKKITKIKVNDQEIENPEYFQSSYENNEKPARPEKSHEQETENNSEGKAWEAGRTSQEKEGLVNAIDTVNPGYAARKKSIEHILQQDLEESYLGMPANIQQEFKRVGEETADKINQILQRTKFKIIEIIELIRKWLAIIPGVSKFFIEQEAKIKADAIVKLT